MYLVKVRQLRHGEWLTRVPLPNLERLDRLNSMLIYIAWPMLTIGIALGFALQQLVWSDPKVIVTCIAWLLFTALVNYRHQPTHRGRRVAVMTIFACVVVLVSVLGDPLFGTGHLATPGGLP